MAISKHIIAQDTLTSRNKGICINEPAQFGIVIPALDVIEPGVYWASGVMLLAQDPKPAGFMQPILGGYG